MTGFQYRQCLEFLDEMTEMGIPKNVIIFGAAMSCIEKCSRADIGFQLMKRMKEEGIAPNVHIYNSAISACARSNLWEKGYELYEEMEAVGVNRDVVTYNAGKHCIFVVLFTLAYHLIASCFICTCKFLMPSALKFSLEDGYLKSELSVASTPRFPVWGRFGSSWTFTSCRLVVER
jgi:pentatricopeptide repeat protein